MKLAYELIHKLNKDCINLKKSMETLKTADQKNINDETAKQINELSENYNDFVNNVNGNYILNHEYYLAFEPYINVILECDEHLSGWMNKYTDKTYMNSACSALSEILNKVIKTNIDKDMIVKQYHDFVNSKSHEELLDNMRICLQYIRNNIEYKRITQDDCKYKIYKRYVEEINPKFNAIIYPKGEGKGKDTSFVLDQTLYPNNTPVDKRIKRLEGIEQDLAYLNKEFACTTNTSIKNDIINVFYKLKKNIF